MNVVNDLYYWTDRVLFAGFVVLWVWAFADCLTRKAAAFPAVDKLSKMAWLGILAFAGVLGALTGKPPSSPIGVISLIAVIVASVYLADVRPAVRGVTGGDSRW